MLHILLMILKILGIVILSVLGLLLFILLAVLFVPIRYEVSASKYDTVKAKIKINWFLIVFRTLFLYEDDTFTKNIKVFGFDVIKILEKKNAKTNNNSTKSDTLEEELENEDTLENDYPKLTNNEVDDTISSKDNQDCEVVKQLELEDTNKTINKAINKNTFKKFHKSTKREKTFLEQVRTMFESIKNKVNRLFNKAKRFIKNLSNRIKALFKKAKDIKKTILNVIRFLNSDEFKRNFAFIKGQVSKLFKHIMPRKHNIKLNIGTGSPDTTGEILGGIAIFMAFTGMNISVLPDFENEVFRGEVYLKGRIRLFNILVIGLKTYFNKDLKTMFNKIMNGGFKNGK